MDKKPMAPSDRKRTSRVDSDELLALSKSVASIHTSVKGMVRDQLPAVARDAREARDGVIRLAVSHEELSKRVVAVEDAEPEEHDCHQIGAISAQDKQIAGLTGKWKWAASAAVAIAISVVGAYVTMNRSDAQIEVRVNNVEKTINRHEKTFESLDKTLRAVPIEMRDVVKEDRTLVIKAVQEDNADLEDLAVHLTEREVREFLRLTRKIKNGDG